MSPCAERIPGRFEVLLAGLQAGMVAALAMLAWMGSSAIWQRRSFWTSENLLATMFYGGTAVHNGFSKSTISGLALYLLVYSVLGCVFAAAIRGRPATTKLLAAAIAVALIWYYLSFHFVWKAISPLVPLLYPVKPTILGHIIYGAVLGRFPRYLPRSGSAAAVDAGEAAPASTEISDG
jgi:hypothetical protein